MSKKLPINVTILEERYRRAESFLLNIFSPNCPEHNLVMNTMIVPTWITDSDCFWYERETREGKSFRLVDALAKTNIAAFDHTMLARALSKAASEKVNKKNLPIDIIEFKLTPLHVKFMAFDKIWLFDIASASCYLDIMTTENWKISPDRSKAVFSRGYNLWMRDLISGTERQVTDDGEGD